MTIKNRTLQYLTCALACAILTMATAATTSANAQSLETWNTACQKFLREYTQKPPHKAFAVSYLNSGSGGGQSCGAAWGASSKAQAEAQTIESC